VGGLKLGTLQTFDSVRIPLVVLSAKIPHTARKYRNIPARSYQLDRNNHWKEAKEMGKVQLEENYWY